VDTLITEHDLHEAIAECQGERNPNANTCIKLAAYYTILNNMRSESPTFSLSPAPTEQVRYDSGSEFADAIQGKDINSVLSVMDDLMEAVAALMPKLYRATMEKL
jgi:hypothetical protein